MMSSRHMNTMTQNEMEVSFFLALLQSCHCLFDWPSIKIKIFYVQPNMDKIQQYTYINSQLDKKKFFTKAILVSSIEHKSSSVTQTYTHTKRFGPKQPMERDKHIYK